LRSAKDYQCYLAALKILLIAHIFIGSYDHVETGFLRCQQQLAIA